jgi:hypothetical protein
VIIRQFQYCPTVRVTTSRKRPGHTESYNAVATVGGSPFACGRAQRPGPEDQRSSSIAPHALPGPVRSRVADAGFVGAAIGWRAGVAFGVTILRPLPNIAGHVVKTKSVRGLQSHGMSLATRIVLVPGMIWRRSVIVAPPEARACPGTRGPCSNTRANSLPGTSCTTEFGLESVTVILTRL